MDGVKSSNQRSDAQEQEVAPTSYALLSLMLILWMQAFLPLSLRLFATA